VLRIQPFTFSHTGCMTHLPQSHVAGEGGDGGGGGEGGGGGGGGDSNAAHVRLHLTSGHSSLSPVLRIQPFTFSHTGCMMHLLQSHAGAEGGCCGGVAYGAFGLGAGEYGEYGEYGTGEAFRVGLACEAGASNRMAATATPRPKLPIDCENSALALPNHVAGGILLNTSLKFVRNVSDEASAAFFKHPDR
jgi:hypothetical protein